MEKRRRPKLRLLFDELASPRVARALAALDLVVAHVGQDGFPPKGSDDEEVLAAAKRARLVIVTNNHDMIVLCAQERESIVWLDPRDKDMTFEGQVMMCFQQVAEWERLLSDTDVPICIQAQKTTCKPLTLASIHRFRWG